MSRLSMREYCFGVGYEISSLRPSMIKFLSLRSQIHRWDVAVTAAELVYPMNIANETVYFFNLVFFFHKEKFNMKMFFLHT